MSMDDGCDRRPRRLSKERMEELATADGFVFDAAGNKLRKPRLSNDVANTKKEMPPEPIDLGSLAYLVASVVTMLAYKSDWAGKCGITQADAEYVAPAFGLAAAVVLQKVATLAQSLLVLG